MLKALRLVTGLVAALALTACTVQDTPMPGLSGPSELALSLSVTATPDSISQDGASQSAILVVARDARGRAISALPIRLDMMVGGVIQDFGRLSARTVVTGTDGRATTVYTAPAAPPVDLGGSGTLIAIVATPTSTNFQTALSQTTEIRLVPAGVILPPAGTPTASFRFSPTAPFAKAAVLFDASTSSPGSGASQISSYVWDFSDGSAQGGGRTVNHTFQANGTFNVTLTVTNDRGLSASTTQAVEVQAAEGPTASFTFSPSAPVVQQTVFFDAATSTAAAGHTITSYRWSFDDGATGTGVSASHAYSVAGTYQAQLTVTDEAGQTSTVENEVTVTSNLPTADFTFSPASPRILQAVVFSASPSKAIAGHPITAYQWTFDDGATGTGISVTHAFASAGPFGVQLRVTDDAGQTSAPVKKTVTVTDVAPTAKFQFSPTTPQVNQEVVFDASESRPGAGHTLVSYSWNFGDGATKSGMVVSHDFGASGTFNVTLTVTDEVGQITTVSGAVPVGTGTGGPQAAFVFSPASPVTAGAVTGLVTFDATESTAAAGSTIVTFQWQFECATSGCTAADPVTTRSTSTVTHAYLSAGTFVVKLTVFDTASRTASTTRTITVQ